MASAVNVKFYDKNLKGRRGILMNNRVSEAEVARILSLIVDPRNMRDDPDNPNYIRLFDGGLLKVETGAMRYEFSDGPRRRP